MTRDVNRPLIIHLPEGSKKNLGMEPCLGPD